VEGPLDLDLVDNLISAEPQSDEHNNE